MAKIWRRSDRLKVKIGEVVLTLAPLNNHEKSEIASLMAKGTINQDFNALRSGSILSVKYSVKSISGVLDQDDKPYELKFEGEYLTEECLNDLFNLGITKQITQVCAALVKNVPDEFTDDKGNKLEGVEILKKDVPEKNV